MTLLVADDDRRSLRDVLAETVVTVEAGGISDAVARDEPDVVVVDAGAVADPGDVVATVRSTVPHAAVVAVGTTDVDADVTCAAANAASVRAAVERARRIAKYRRSVTSLYEACRDRALGRPDGDVREHRKDADQQLDALPDDSEAVAAALRSEEENG